MGGQCKTVENDRFNFNCCQTCVDAYCQNFEDTGKLSMDVDPEDLMLYQRVDRPAGKLSKYD